MDRDSFSVSFARFDRISLSSVFSRMTSSQSLASYITRDGPGEGSGAGPGDGPGSRSSLYFDRYSDAFSIDNFNVFPYLSHSSRGLQFKRIPERIDEAR